MRALVTGMTGFVGGHLGELLAACGDEVVGCSPTGRWDDADLERWAAARGVSLRACDLTDAVAVDALIDRARPEVVYHLAAMANPAVCRREPHRARRVNVDGTRNLFTSLARITAPPRVLFVSSSYVYGRARPADLPLSEQAPLRGRGHPYADSKLEGERIAEQFAQRGIESIRVRPFNHAGPRQQAHLIAEWSHQVAAIEAGRQDPVLHHGNLESRRDWTDVRDVVRAYRLLVEKGVPGDVYNLGSGISRSGREILQCLQTLTPVAIQPQLDEALLRPDDAPEIVADATRLRRVTGWRSEIPLETTLRDTLAYWRRREGVKT